jgi:uncharacterized protein YkwD
MYMRPRMVHGIGGGVTVSAISAPFMAWFYTEFGPRISAKNAAMLMRRRLLICVPALVLLAGCESAEDGTADGTDFNAHCDAQADWNAAWAAYETQVVQLVNDYRAAGAICGADTYGPAGPVVAESQLRCAARLHSEDMAVRGFFDHDNPDGLDPWARVDLTDYSGDATGENIAQGYPDPAAVMDGWMNSPGHCRNIMNPDTTELGVGYYGEDNYWTQVMGRR